jgi:hypothetical protein
MHVPSFLAHITGIASGFGVLAMSKGLLERPHDNPAGWLGIALDMSVYALLLLFCAGVVGTIQGWLFGRVNAYSLAFSATLPIIILWLILVSVASPGALGFPVVLLYYFVVAVSARKGSSFARRR